MLVTGIFDDLAWIINFRYTIGLSSKEVYLRKDENNKSNKKLWQYLYNHNRSLHAYLTNSLVQNQIKLFYLVRDALMHQKFLGSVQHMSSEVGNKVMLTFPQNAIEKLIEESGGDVGQSWGIYNMSDVEPYAFTTRAFEVIAKTVNSVLDLLEWAEIIQTLPSYEQDEIRKSQGKFQLGVGHFLGWKQEPMYF
jgi:hypothetical protein